MNYLECINKWGKVLEGTGLEYEYRVAKGYNGLRPKDGMLSLKDLVNNECYIECKVVRNESEIHDILDDFIQLLNKTVKSRIKVEDIKALQTRWSTGTVGITYRFY